MDLDARVRVAAFTFLANQTRLLGEVLPRTLLAQGFSFEGRRVNTSEGVAGSKVFLDLARDPMILDVVEQLIGRDICLWGCQVFCKPAGNGMEVPMHQDGNYWPIRPLATCTVNVLPDPVGVPEICPVVVFNESPAGSDPVRTDHV